MESLAEAIRSGGRRHPAAIWVIRAAFALLLIPVVLASFLYIQQHKFIYHPRPYFARELQGLPNNLVELDFGTGSGRQTAFYLAPTGATRLPDRIWVAFCGNGSVGLDWRFFIGDFRDDQDGFLLVDYPGYGKSEGYATIAGTRAAADGALSALAERLEIEVSELEPRLNLIGHSLGAGAALDFAAQHPVQRIVLFAPFTTLREEAATVVGGWLSRLLVENYDNRARLKELSRRTLRPRIAIVHGMNDDVIPFRMGQALAQEFPELVQFFPIPDGDHVSVLRLSRTRVLEWMKRSAG